MTSSKEGDGQVTDNAPPVIVVTDDNIPSSSNANGGSNKRAANAPAKNKFEHLKKKRLSYPAKFKAQVIYDRESGMTPSELTSKYSNFRIDEPKICRWMKNKVDIKKAALGEYKNLFKIRPAIKYIKLFEELKTVFLAARSKGHGIDFNWLWSKARQIYKSQESEDAIVRKHVVANFIRRHHLKYRRVQRNRGAPKEAFREKLQK